jgi:hypothetical protein
MYIDTKDLISSIKKIMAIYILYLLIEAGTRVTVFFLNYSGGNILAMFYSFKHGVFWKDTNFLGVLEANVICLNLFLFDYTKDKVWKNYTAILCILILSTFSRSAIIAVLGIVYIYFVVYLIKKKYYIGMMVGLVIAIIGLFYIFSLIVYDGSFNTKIDILEGLKKIKNTNMRNLFFGFGFTEGNHAYSYKEGAYGHLHIALLLGWYGITG